MGGVHQLRACVGGATDVACAVDAKSRASALDAAWVRRSGRRFHFTEPAGHRTNKNTYVLGAAAASVEGEGEAAGDGAEDAFLM